MGKARRKGDRGECAVDEGEQKLYLQDPLLECRVPEQELVFLSDLPGGLDYNEWMASHTIGFFEHVNLCYGTISEYCTPSTCQDMIGPGPRTYMWIDDKGKKSRLSAPQYVDYVMTYCQRTINDELIFPTKHGNEFPPNFESQYIRKIFRLLFHVLAHVYHSHFREVVLLQLHAHLNAVFAHFVGFTVKFNLLEDKELEVLSDLIVALKILPPSLNDADRRGAPSETAEAEENKENNPSQSTEEVITAEPQPSSSLGPSKMEGTDEGNSNDSSSSDHANSSSNCVEMVSDVDCSISEKD